MPIGSTFLLHQDNDGVCDELEVVGCLEPRGEVLEIIHVDQAEQIETVLDLHHLSAGLYLLEMEFNQQKAYRKISIK